VREWHVRCNQAKAAHAATPLALVNLRLARLWPTANVPNIFFSIFRPKIKTTYYVDELDYGTFTVSP
jgi:hypothetical protein